MDKFYRHREFYERITSITILIMFLVINANYSPENWLHRFVAGIIPTKNPIAGLITAFVLSTGLFNIISRALSFGSRKIRRVKHFLLQRLFLEGVWVGYIVEEGEVTLIVEKIMQSYEDVTVDGASYELMGNDIVMNSYWRSTVSKLDPGSNRLEYTYANICVSKNELDFTGFASFNFNSFSVESDDFRNDNKFDFPLLRAFSMRGELHDFSQSGKKKISIERKVSDSLAHDIDYYRAVALKFWQYNRNSMVVTRSMETNAGILL